MTGQSIFEYRLAHILAWKSDGSQIAVATDDWVDEIGEYQNQQIEIINATSGQIERSIPVGNFSLTFLSWRHNDAELFMINSIGEVKRFNAQDGSLISQWSFGGYQAFGAVNLHPDGSMLAIVVYPNDPNRLSGQSQDKVLEIYNADTGAIIQTFMLPLQANDSSSWLAWSPDGTRFAITNRYGSLLVYLWNGTAFSFQRQINFVSEDTGSSWGAWGPNSRDLAVVTARRTSLSGIVVYNTNNGTVLRQMNQSLGAGGAHPVWSKETNLIASRIGSSVRVWDGTTGQVIQDFDYTGKAFFVLAWSLNGTLAVGRRMEYDELVQNPNLTGVLIHRLKNLTLSN